MSLIVYNNKYVTSGGKMVGSISLPSEAPAISMLHNFRTGLEAVYVDYDRLPVSQAELELYGVDFSPSGVYTFAFYPVDSSLCYCNATSSNGAIHSFTMTVSYTLDDITCQKLGTTAPGVADYIGGVLSCQLGTEEV